MKSKNIDWKSRTTVTKGDYAEKLIDDHLEKIGFIMYAPTTPKAHAFDRLAVKDKWHMIIAECKAKPRRNCYADTGIEISHYNQYKFIQEKYGIKVYIFFVDEMLGEIYANSLEKLERPKKVKNKNYPSREKSVIYFPLENMKTTRKLTAEEIDFLKGNSNRSYAYATVG